MKTAKPKNKPAAKKPRPKIVGYLIVTKTGGYMRRGAAGQILAPADAPVQFQERRSARRLITRYERQVGMLRESLVGDWPKITDLAALCPLTIQPVHAA